MDNFLDKIFFRSRNLDYISQNLIDLTNQTPANKIFEALNSYSHNSEVRYVGGCVRKIIKKQIVDDIDLSTNLKPSEVCDALKKKEINFYETGIEHGTVTAIIDNNKYEITSLRKDISTDGRHAKVEFSIDWKEDAARRDFSINSIYSDKDGNLFDPYNGKKDLEEGNVNFIGDAESRVKEDYLRILRYVRFFINYSNQSHDPKIIKIIKRNIGGVSKLSSERLLDELKKLTKSEAFLKIFNNKTCLELIKIIFPQLTNLDNFIKLNSHAKENLSKVDFIFLLSLMVVDGTDNTDYFIYKFNLSKKYQKRLKSIIFYYNGKQTVLDIINFKLFSSVKVEKKLLKLIEIYKNKILPTFPISAKTIMAKYNIPEGKILGNKLKMIEETWVQNGFQISEKQIQKIIKS